MRSLVMSCSNQNHSITPTPSRHSSEFGIDGPFLHSPPKRAYGKWYARGAKPKKCRVFAL